MSPALLDLIDCNLQVWHADRHIQSPGYALLDGAGYTFGNTARAAARLRPREINTRYWWQLGTEPLTPALGPARHTGDLAHAHLNALHREASEPAECIVAVSDTMERQQLSLLLGIMQQCPFKAVGLVSRSAALASLYQHNGRVFHLELQLHQAALAEVRNDGRNSELHGTTPLPGCGVMHLQERLVELISASFVRQARFDPRRQAASEQQLYDALPEVLENLRREQECNLDIAGHRARIDRAVLAPGVASLASSTKQVANNLGSDDLLLLDPIAALLPGLEDLPGRRVCLNPGDVYAALDPLVDQLVQDEPALHYVTHIPNRGLRDIERSGEPPVASAATTSPGHATHLLQGHRGLPLAAAGTPLAAGWQLLRDAGQWVLRGAGTAPLVNGQNYEPGQALNAGDTIEIGANYSARLIEVEA